MGLWSKTIKRSQTGEERLEDLDICFFEYQGRVIELKHWPEYRSVSGEYHPLDVGSNISDCSVRLKFRRIEDILFIKECMERGYQKKIDCVLWKKSSDVVNMYGTIISRIVEDELCCYIDYLKI